MQNWWKTQNLWMLVGVIVALIFAAFFMFIIIKTQSKEKDKYKSVLYPKTTPVPTEFVDDKKKKKKKKVDAKKKNFFSRFLEKKHFNEKMSSYYLRAGIKNKTSKDFIFDLIKYFIFGIGRILAVLMRYRPADSVGICIKHALPSEQKTRR